LKLPGGEQAWIDSRKLREYILSPSHPVGRFKAVFFAKLGYTQANWQELEAALRRSAIQDEAEARESTPYGQKYAVRSILEGPSGTRAEVISIWIVRSGEMAPRLITVMPVR
jgi:uncharacterized protein DUF6883